jgi:hypothetical protein
LITFDFEISFFDVVALAISAGLAIYVAGRLEKDTNAERCEKDILIGKLKSLEDIIGTIMKKASDSEIVQLSEIIALIGDFDQLSDRVIKEFQRLKYIYLITNRSDFRADFGVLDSLCTDDRFDDWPSDSIVMDENDSFSTCIYSLDRRSAIQEKASEISDKLFSLQLLLNRA